MNSAPAEVPTCAQPRKKDEKKQVGRIHPSLNSFTRLLSKQKQRNERGLKKKSFVKRLDWKGEVRNIKQQVASGTRGRGKRKKGYTQGKKRKEADLGGETTAKSLPFHCNGTRSRDDKSSMLGQEAKVWEQGGRRKWNTQGGGRKCL